MRDAGQSKFSFTPVRVRLDLYVILDLVFYNSLHPNDRTRHDPLSLPEGLSRQ